MTTLVPSFLDGSCSFVQETRINIKAWMSMNFGHISSPTTMLAALELVKN